MVDNNVAREQLRATVASSRIEDMARELRLVYCGGALCTPWSQLPEHVRDYWRASARMIVACVLTPRHRFVQEENHEQLSLHQPRP